MRNAHPVAIALRRDVSPYPPTSIAGSHFFLFAAHRGTPDTASLALIFSFFLHQRPRPTRGVPFFFSVFPCPLQFAQIRDFRREL
jgi:hypothetical protein